MFCNLRKAGDVLFSLWLRRAWTGCCVSNMTEALFQFRQSVVQFVHGARLRRDRRMALAQGVKLVNDGT